MVDSVKGKELLMHRYKKYPQICPDSMTNKMELFLFTVVFLPPFSLFHFLFSVLYTMVFVPFSPSTCESDVGSFSVLVRPSLNLLLLAVRLLVYYSGITSTLMRPEG